MHSKPSFVEVFELTKIMYVSWGIECIVAEQRGTRLKLQGYVACEKTETEIRISLFMSGGGFYFDLRIKEAGYAWAAWRMGGLSG